MDPDTIFKTPYAVNKDEIKRTARFLGERASKIKKSDDKDAQDGVTEDDPRFYGSGVDPEFEELLDYVDKAESEPDSVDLTELKKRFNSLQRAISENSRIRTKHPDEPLKFADSECVLNESIKRLIQVLDNDPYSQLLDLDFIPAFSSLLMHENVDICLSTVDLLDELLDEDVSSNDDYEKHVEAKKFLDLLLENGCFELIIQNLYRFEEFEKPEDRTGVYRTMNIIENTLSINAEIAELLVSKTKLMEWLVQRIKEKSFDTNILYAVEVLSILLLNRRSNRIKFCTLGGIDNLLQIISKYRKKDPESMDEVEFLQNTYNALISSLYEPEVKEEFHKLEGVELMIITLRNMKMSRISSILTLDAAFNGHIGLKVCEDLSEEFINLGGLKYLLLALIPDYMKRYAKRYKKEFEAKRDIESVLGILHSMFRHTKSAIDLQRILRKFYENNYQKIITLIDLYKKKLEEYNESKLSFDTYAGNDEEYHLEMDVSLKEKMERNGTILMKLTFIISNIYVNSDKIEDMRSNLVRLLGENSIDIQKLRDDIKGYMNEMEKIKIEQKNQDRQIETSDSDSISNKIIDLETRKLSNIAQQLEG